MIAAGSLPSARSNSGCVAERLKAPVLKLAAAGAVLSRFVPEHVNSQRVALHRRIVSSRVVSAVPSYLGPRLGPYSMPTQVWVLLRPGCPSLRKRITHARRHVIATLAWGWPSSDVGGHSAVRGRRRHEPISTDCVEKLDDGRGRVPRHRVVERVMEPLCLGRGDGLRCWAELGRGRGSWRSRRQHVAGSRLLLPCS